MRCPPAEFRIVQDLCRRHCEGSWRHGLMVAHGFAGRERRTDICILPRGVSRDWGLRNILGPRSRQIPAAYFRRSLVSLLWLASGGGIESCTGLSIFQRLL